MEIRVSAKGLVSCGDQSFVFVAGRRGMWNLPGGGINSGETADMAFIREANEEIANFSNISTSPVNAFTIEGQVTSDNDVSLLARWVVFRAALIVPSAELSIPENSEITAITTFSADECLQRNNVSKLAQSAVRLAVRPDHATVA